MVNGIKEMGWFRNSRYLLPIHNLPVISVIIYNYSIFLCYIYYICYYIAMRRYK